MATLDDVAAIALELPEVVEGDGRRGRSWEVRGKTFAWERFFSKADLRRFGEQPVPADPIVAVRVDDLGEKEAVLTAGHKGFFTIPHFDGFAAVLIELGVVGKRPLRAAIIDGWASCAPDALVAEHRRSPAPGARLTTAVDRTRPTEEVSDAAAHVDQRRRPSSDDPDEPNRTSTHLELFFDLCIVVGVSRAGAGLHHELVEGHIADGVIGFAMGFFGVWWAWMNFTWFASAHDADDVPYRLLTLVQMAGALVYAAGVTDAVEEQVFTLAVIGYLIMRAGLVAQWLRVARIPSMRRRALRYAGGVTVIQLLWLGILVAPSSWRPVVFLVLAIAELCVPVWAERGVGHTARTYRLFHPEHIDERYGLFTIIVLGETILSATIGIGEVAAGGVSAGLIAVALSGLLLAFGAWWLYFDHPGHLTPTPEVAIRWGYTHVVVFASLAALGPGVQVAAEAVDGAVSDRTGPSPSPCRSPATSSGSSC